MMVIGREGEIIGIGRTEPKRHETLQNYNFFALSYKQSGKYCGGQGLFEYLFGKFVHSLSIHFYELNYLQHFLEFGGTGINH
ncbi:MAG: hypothetical protein ACI3X6_01605 [Alloprevotella sp.]